MESSGILSNKGIDFSLNAAFLGKKKPKYPYDDKEFS